MTCTCPMSVRESGRHSVGCPDHPVEKIRKIRRDIGKDWASFEFPTLDAARTAWRKVNTEIDQGGNISAWSHMNRENTRYFVTAMGESPEVLAPAITLLSAAGGERNDAYVSDQDGLLDALRARRWNTALEGLMAGETDVHQEAHYESGAEIDRSGQHHPLKGPRIT